MATDYPGAVRNGTMAAARLHVEFGTREGMDHHGGSVDIFATAVRLSLPLILRPLNGLLGAYIPAPIPGVLVTTERPLSIQRFTAAHELGHFRLQHRPSFDDEKILRRMSMAAATPSPSDPDFQEAEADAFAVAFLMPRWLIDWHCSRQGWLKSDLRNPIVVYQLALRMGVSYEALTWTLERYRLIAGAAGRTLRSTQPREIKATLLEGHRPTDYRGDVWLLTERDATTRISGSKNDHFVLRLNEHSGGGYLWNMDQLQHSGFAVVRDVLENTDHDGIGGPIVRHVTATTENSKRGQVALRECRPWQPAAPIAEVTLDYDFTGPENEGLSRAERRHVLDAA